LIDWAEVLDQASWQKHRPLVFINGCHTCQLSPGQFFSCVTAFTYLGAGGVIGTEVSVLLSAAVEVAELFFTHVTQANPELSVGESLRQVRAELAAKGNLLGLAYTSYCLASLRLK
jgi:hypothetical protein